MVIGCLTIVFFRAIESGDIKTFALLSLFSVMGKAERKPEVSDTDKYY